MPKAERRAASNAALFSKIYASPNSRFCCPIFAAVLPFPSSIDEAERGADRPACVRSGREREAGGKGTPRVKAEEAGGRQLPLHPHLCRHRHSAGSRTFKINVDAAAVLMLKVKAATARAAWLGDRNGGRKEGEGAAALAVIAAYSTVL